MSKPFWFLCVLLCVHTSLSARFQPRRGYKSRRQDRQLLQCGVPDPDPNVNECLNGQHNCNANANCLDTDRSFTCTCKTGYTGNGVQCSDNNECSTDPCDDKATCTNTAGSFSCSCQTGYIGSGVSCSDINECDESPCHVDATCTNNDGSYQCACNGDLVGDGVNSCHEQVTLVDECASNAHNCHSEATCSDTDASFTCACSSGYSGDGVSCSDDDECISSPCDTNAACDNTPGGYTCTCGEGFTGNGMQCTAVEPDSQDVTTPPPQTPSGGNDEGGDASEDVDENGNQNANEDEEDQDESEDNGSTFQVTATTTLAGVTVAEAEAMTEQIAASIAQTLDGVDPDQVEILGFSAVGARRLLAEGVAVEFAVSGFESQAAAQAVAQELDSAGEELVTNLKARGLASVTAVTVTSVSAERIATVPPGPTSTPAEAAPSTAGAREAHVWATVAVATVVAVGCRRVMVA